MGNAEYAKYLRSPHWEGLKAEKESQVWKHCQVCWATQSIDCHHLQYRGLYGAQPQDLVWLCRRCHYLTHEMMEDGRLVFKDRCYSPSLKGSVIAAVRNELGLSSIRQRRAAANRGFEVPVDLTAPFVPGARENRSEKWRKSKAKKRMFKRIMCKKAQKEQAK